MPKKCIPLEDILANDRKRELFDHLADALAKCWTIQAEQNEPIAIIRKRAKKELHVDVMLLNRAAKDRFDNKRIERLKQALDVVRVHERDPAHPDDEDATDYHIKESA